MKGENFDWKQYAFGLEDGAKELREQLASKEKQIKDTTAQMEMMTETNAELHKRIKELEASYETQVRNNAKLLTLGTEKNNEIASLKAKIKTAHNWLMRRTEYGAVEKAIEVLRGEQK